MIGYTLETRRLVAKSLLWSAYAPALTREQIKHLAPTIIVRPPAPVDEWQRRYDDPTVYDLARMSPLQRWKRGNALDLREGLPGSDLIVSGEQILTRRQYTTAVVTKSLAPIHRYHQQVAEYEHTFAPCERHTMVPLGEESVSWKEIKQLYLSPDEKFIPGANHIHTVVREIVEDIGIRWRCTRCPEWGDEPYTMNTLAATTSLVHYGCTRCSNGPDWKDHGSRMSRAEFVSRMGVAAGAFYSTWIGMKWGHRKYPGTPSPPDAEGAPSIFFVDFLNGNDTTGDGSTLLPWKLLQKARANMVANNNDTVKARGTDGVTTTYYNEVFTPSLSFPFGASFANATIITKDTGHTPVIRYSGSPVSATMEITGSTQRYHIYSGFIWDGAAQGAQGGLIYFYTTTTTGTNRSAGAAKFMRVTGCELRNAVMHVGGHPAALDTFHGGNHEILLNMFHDITSNGASSLHHATYLSGPDQLAEGNLFYNVMIGGGGFCIHGYGPSFVSSDVQRSVYRRNKLRNSRNGLIFGGNINTMAYYNLIYKMTPSTNANGIYVRYANDGVVNDAKILNNTLVSNTGFGIHLGATAPGTIVVGAILRNNIAVSNTLGPIEDFGSGTSIGTTNSWLIGSFDAKFISAATDDYHIGTGSSAIDAGTTVASTINSGTFPETPVLDFDSVALSGNPDVGAYEFVSGGGGGGTPILSVSPAVLTFFSSGPNPASQTFQIVDIASTGTMAWTASDNQTWLSLSSANGTGDTTITVSVDVTGLVAGVYNATITVTASGATNSPATIPVTLTNDPAIPPESQGNARVR